LKRPSFVLVLLVLVGWSVSATAQPRNQKWEIEVHAGAAREKQTDSGTAIGDFPRGNPIPTGAGTFTSRAVSSWYFGDGSVLLNQVNGTFLVAARITPLDVALRQPIARRTNGGAFGVRVARHLTDRFAAEFNVDYSRSSLQLTDEAAAAIETTRSTFITAWLALLGTGATTNRNVTSVAEIERGSGHQLITSGAIRIRLGDWSRFAPYVTGGAGGVFNRGVNPSATLTGSYSFLFGATIPLSETDTLTVRTASEDTALIGVLGGGFTFDVSDRHGIRADLRLQLGGSPVNTVIDATPAVVMTGAPFAISTGLNPSVQFANTTTLNRPSSLSGPRIAGQETFSGSGTNRQMTFAVGYFVRF
jgi:hypothetical protein